MSISTNDVAALARTQALLDGLTWDTRLDESKLFYERRAASLTPAARTSPPIRGGVGALEQWQQEVRAGVSGQDVSDPDTWAPDGLAIAAQWEAAALTAAHVGRSELARACMARAVTALGQLAGRAA